MLKPKNNNRSRQVALITGGAQRIGESIGCALHKRGVDIVIHCNQSKRQAEKLAEQFNLKRNNSAIVLQADLSCRHSANDLVSATISYFGQLDYLVNNASIFYPTAFLQDDYETSLKLFNCINFSSPIALISEAQHYLAKSQGAVLNLIDIYANSGLFEHTAYVASKAALNAVTKQLSVQLAPQIRVNGISPGAILWPDSSESSSIDNESLSLDKQSQKKQQSIISNTALKRKGSAEDISATAAFLLIDASYITGMTIAVDGGRQLYI